jgi:hypothetical protein
MLSRITTRTRLKLHQAATTSTVAEVLKPVTKLLEDAGIPIGYGPNPKPAPETLSDRAKMAWVHDD